METATKEPQTADAVDTGGNGENTTPPTATRHRQPMGSETASLWLIVIVVLVGAGIWFWVADRGQQDTIIPGVSGIQGNVVSIDFANESFRLDKKKVLEDNGTFTFEEESYTVHWTQNTVFYTYDKPSSVAKDFTSLTDLTALQPNKNVIVTPRERAGNVITATEIRILPGSSKAQIVE